MIDVKELKDNFPDYALLLDVNGDEPPQFSKLDYAKVPVCDLEVGSYILVRAGEVCAKYLITFVCKFGWFVRFYDTPFMMMIIYFQVFVNICPQRSFHVCLP